jgi:hypothetical protein
MEQELSMSARAEITRTYALAYKQATRSDKSTMLDQLCEVTGWSRDNARRRLTGAAKPRPVLTRKPRAGKYSYDAVKVLQRVWAASGGQCGKYLAESMPVLLEALETHGELAPGRQRFSDTVRSELLAMSAATIDRYLGATKSRNALHGLSTTTPSPLLRSTIQIRKAGDEVEAVPGFFEVDTVAHCGPSLKGEFVRSLNMTDMFTGWVHTHSIRNNAHIHIRHAVDTAVEMIPFEVTGMDFDNGSEFINYDMVSWAAERDIYFTRSRPYKKHDQATIESKNNHVVRKYAYYWRYDNPEVLALLGQLWPLVNDRMNYFTPTKKPIGFTTTSQGRRRRVFDTPRTPLDRLLDSGILSSTRQEQLLHRRAQLNPAHLGREIDRLQQKLTSLARTPTLRLEAQHHKPLPDIHTGMKKRHAS